MIGASNNPYESYRRIDLDARVEGSDPAGLTLICLQKASDELSYARACFGPDRAGGRMTALQRAGNAVLALQSGIAPDNPMRTVLLDFYGSLFQGITQLKRQWQDDTAVQLQRDLEDIAASIN
jgi:flagellin-specific chaperone FliS